MKKKKIPFYRKNFVPLSFVNKLDYIILGFTALVIIFAASGILLCREYDIYKKHIWVPCALIILSCILIFSAAARILKRFDKKVYSKRS